MARQNLPWLLLFVVAACSEGRVRNRQVPSDFDKSLLVPAGASASKNTVPDGPGSVSQIDEALGVPTFTWADQTAADVLSARSRQSAEDAARAYLADYSARYRFDANIAKAVHVKGVSTAGDAVIVQLGRNGTVKTFDGESKTVDVFRDEVKMIMKPNHALVAIGGNMTPQSATTPSASRLVLSSSPESALAFALTDLSGTAFSESDFALEGEESYALAGSSPVTFTTPARIRPTIFPLAQGLEAAYYIELDIQVGDQENMFSYVIAGNDGRVLFRKNLNDAHSFRVFATPEGFPLDSPYGDTTPHPEGTPSGWAASPSNQSVLIDVPYGPISTQDPWLSPDATTLFGNNVRAYADLVKPTGFGEGDLGVEVTSPGVFDYAFDPNLTANGSTTQIKAATTTLFYVNNFLHDWFYDAGFDEKSGNAQLVNYGRGGVEGDPLLAEAQDYGGRNNANMSTPADGRSPRMQMYVFDNPSIPSISFSGNATLSAQQLAGAGFGASQYSISNKDLILGEDAVAPAGDGCTPYSNSTLVSGLVAVVDRGACSFLEKAKQAELAGARALVVLNNQPAMLEVLGGTDPNVTIPVVMIDQESGNALRAALAAGKPMRVTLNRGAPNDRDGTLDTLIVAHEWGHYISNRLVANSAGLVTNQSRGLGEGWGDFTALLLTVKESDLELPNNSDFSGAYALAQFTSYGGNKKNGYYYGIRRTPLSTDFAINPLTLKHISNGSALPDLDRGYAFGKDGANNAEVHNVGEIWANMLWECYASLLNDQTRGRTFAEKQDLMKKYLVASLKLTPVAPTLLEARDAVLAAALANDEQDYELFWKAFAKRGAGIRAKGPGKTSEDNVGVTESFKVGADIAIASLELDGAQELCAADDILDNGETLTLKVTLKNTGIGAVAPMALVASPTDGMLIAGGGFLTFASIGPMQSASASVQVTADTLAAITRVDLDVTASDPKLTLPALQQRVSLMANFDVALDASLTDDVEAPVTAWTPTHASGPELMDYDWQRAPESVEQTFWWGANLPATGDISLVTPALETEASGFELSFSHFYALEKGPDQTGAIHAYDGGVIEVSTDGGTTWVDVATVQDPGYTDTLEGAAGGSKNPLGDRRAFSGETPNFPEPQALTLKFGADYGNKSVKVRFRLGSDQGARFWGWAIDDIVVKGVKNKPFSKRVPNATVSCPQ